jgi:hypothetical protein
MADSEKPPDQSRDYVGPRLVPKAAAPVTVEPEAKVVLNLPVGDGGKADEEQVKKARARRRTATVRVARADIPDLIKAAQGEALEARREVPPAHLDRPAPMDRAGRDVDVDVDLDEPSQPGTAQATSGQTATLSARPPRGPVTLSRPPTSAVLSRPPPARATSSKRATLAFLTIAAVGAAIGLFLILDPHFNPDTEQTVEPAAGDAPVAVEPTRTAEVPPPAPPPAAATETATATAEAAVEAAPSTTAVVTAPNRPPPTTWRPAVSPPPPFRPAPPPPAKPPPGSGIPAGI